MTTGKIVRSIFFTGYQLIGMEQLAISADAYFIDDSRF
jgi:hypothetical protein